MGGDNILTLNKWKNFEKLLEHQIYVYKRPNYELGEFVNHPNVKIVEAPLLDISATYIRNCLTQKKSIQYLVPDRVFDYIQHSNMYR